MDDTHALARTISKVLLSVCVYFKNLNMKKTIGSFGFDRNLKKGSSKNLKHLFHLSVHRLA